MPSLLDRYIARQYLVNVVTLLVILFIFVITVDVAVNIDRIWDRAGELAASGAGEATTTRQLALSVIGSADLWWPRILQLFNFINGLALAAGMGFTCAQLVAHRELVAVLASGQSLRRVLRPILAIAILFSAVQLANQELVMPRIAHLLTRDHGDAGKRLLGTSQLELTSDGRGRLVYAESFDADEGTLRGLHVWIRDDAGRAIQRIVADRAVWDGRAWVLEEGLATPTDAAASPTPVDRFETDLDPTAITMRRYRRQIGQNLSWGQLSQMLERRDVLDPARRDELIRLKYGRITMVLTQLLTLGICAPLFITRIPGGTIARALKAAPIAVAGTLGAVFAASTPIPGLPAIVGVALPVIVLSPIAVASVSAMRT
jgi:lipopolysaccharide export LptBFGC system permease protein LptF